MKRELDYGNILTILTELLPKKWVNATLFAIYEGKNFIIKYYFKTTTKGAFKDGETAKLLSDKEILNVFLELDNEFAPHRNSLNIKEKWTTIVIEYDKDGNFRVHFGYDTVQGNELEIISNLEKRFIV